MTKKHKEYVNRYATDLWNICESVIKSGTVTELWSKRLAYCRATVICYEYRDKPVIYLLKSYDTIVACVIVNNSMIYGVDMLRKVYGYTATSSQHIAKFFSHYVDFKARVNDMDSIRLRYYP